jgi:hypothetical protein
MKPSAPDTPVDHQAHHVFSTSPAGMASESCGSDLKPSLSAWLTYSANTIVTAMATYLD